MVCFGAGVFLDTDKGEESVREDETESVLFLDILSVITYTSIVSNFY